LVTSAHVGIVNLLEIGRATPPMPLKYESIGILLHPLGAADLFPGLQGLGTSRTFDFGVPVVTAVLKDVGYLVMSGQKSVEAGGPI
jgi:hypothetical protein